MFKTYFLRVKTQNLYHKKCYENQKDLMTLKQVVFIFIKK